MPRISLVRMVGALGALALAACGTSQPATSASSSASHPVAASPTPSQARPAVLAPAFEVPAAGASVVLPVHLIVHLPPGVGVAEIRMTWDDGTELTNSLPVLTEPDGGGAVIGTINWLGESQPPLPETQQATLTVADARAPDLPLASQRVMALAYDDPATMPIELYWVGGDTLQRTERRIPRTVRVGTAALDELLWGPPPPNLAGFTTALPMAGEVLGYPGRTASWGDRVRLLGLNIGPTGTAVANFSPEMKAYGGGSARVSMIREQVNRTLLQFPSVSRVTIAIDGQTRAVLEP